MGSIFQAAAGGATAFSTFFGLGLRQLLEQVAKVSIWLQFIGLGRLDDLRGEKASKFALQSTIFFSFALDRPLKNPPKPAIFSLFSYIIYSMAPNSNSKIPLSDFHSPSKFSDLIEAFINSQDVRASTMESYQKDLRQFSIWFLRIKLKEISQTMLLSFKKHLEQKRKKLLTISNYILHARRFLEWAGYAEETKGVKGAKRD